MILSTPIPTQQLLSELYSIVRQDIGVIFHTKTLAFFKVSPKTASVVCDMLAGNTLEQCAIKYQISVDEIESFFTKLSAEIEQQIQTHPPKIYETDLLGERLVLLVSQDCNLRCGYCNAAGGDYGQGRGLMSPETAIQTIENFIRDGKFLFKNVQFFGGEPTLNLPAVRAVCQYLTEAYQNGLIAEMPWFTLITNGTLVRDEFIHLVQQYNIIVTFSIDGPQDLHDYYRVDVGKKGSYQRIIKGMKKLRDATNGQQPAAVEATVTYRHLEAGYDHERLQQFFVDELGVDRAHLVLIEAGYDQTGAVSEQERTKWIKDMHTSILPNLTNGSFKASVLGLNLLKKLVFRRISPYLCPVGVAIIAVNADGAIYPCYQLMDDRFYMGQSSQKQVWNTPTYQQVEARMRSNDKFSHTKCQVCWAKGVCNGCLGELYAQTGSIEDRSEAISNGLRLGTEEVLVGLAKLRSDPQAWASVLDGLKKEFNQVDHLDMF